MNILKELRTSLKFTQKHVAGKLGITQQAYANYESDKREPDREMLKKLAELFNCSVDYILGITDSSLPFFITYQINHEDTLEALRQNKNLTQEDAAASLGVSFSHYCALETSGIIGLNEHLANRISDFYNKPISEIFKQEKTTQNGWPLTTEQQKVALAASGLSSEEAEKVIDYVEFVKSTRKL